MNATRLSTTSLAHEPRDLTATRPVLSGATSGGILSGLLQALLPYRAAASKATAPARAEPSLRAPQPDADSGGERREPYLMEQRRPTLGTAD